MSTSPTSQAPSADDAASSSSPRAFTAHSSPASPPSSTTAPPTSTSPEEASLRLATPPRRTIQTDHRRNRHAPPPLGLGPMITTSRGVMPLNPSPQSSGSVGFVGSPGLAASLGMGGSPVSSGVDSPSTSATAGTSSGSSGSSGSFMFPPSPLGKREGKGLEVIGEEEEEEKEVKDEEEKLVGVMRKLDFEEKDGGKGKKEV